MITALLAIHIYQGFLSMSLLKDDQKLLAEVKENNTNIAIFIVTVFLFAPYTSVLVACRKYLSK